MSAIGSVINQLPVTGFQLPAALRHTGDVAFQRELAETEAAQRELADVGARAAAAATAVAQPDLVLRRLCFFGDLCGRSHVVRLFLTTGVYDALNGMPSSCSSLRDSSSVFAVVTTEMFMPRALSTFM